MDESRRFQLNDGVDQLDRWAERASQEHKSVLYRALFTVTDGSVFRNYGVLRDVANPWEHFVLVREDLVLKISFNDHDAFGILYIGPLEEAPGLDLAVDAV